MSHQQDCTSANGCSSCCCNCGGNAGQIGKKQGFKVLTGVLIATFIAATTLIAELSGIKINGELKLLIFAAAYFFAAKPVLKSAWILLKKMDFFHSHPIKI